MAGKRAKLRYNKVSYYDEDLQAISKFCSDMYKCTYIAYLIDREKEILEIRATKNGKAKSLGLPFKFLEGYLTKLNGNSPIRPLSGNYVVEYNGYGWTNSDLYDIGENIASLWGGSCYDIKVKTREKIVEFYCVEHGEKFITECPFSELGENKKGHLLK